MKLIILSFFLLNLVKTFMNNTYTKKNGFEVDTNARSELIIQNIRILNRLKCFGLCEKNPHCHLVSFNSSFCILYSYYAKFYLQQQNSNKSLFEKTNQKNFGLVNYWPIENGEAKDLVSSKNLYDPFNTVYSVDRHGSINSALDFNDGYIRAPSGIYFTNEFSILVWVKLKSLANWQRLFDFANGPANNNVLVALTCSMNNLCFHLYNNGLNLASHVTTIRLDLNVWYHLGFILKNGHYKIYLDGNLAEFNYTGVSNTLNIVERHSNYFGKSNWESDSKGYFFCDEIKFFEIQLTDSDIKNEFNYGYH